jgi:GNAT superfamily N-acetyltransferase
MTIASIPPGTNPRSLVEVVKVSDHHVTALAEFYRAVWDPGATADSVRASRAAAAESNPVSPGHESPTVLFLRDGRALGHLTTIPTRVWSGGTERPAHWLKGLMVLPEYRNGPVGFALAKETIRHVGCALAIAVQPSAWKLFCALGFADLGVMSNHLLILKPASVLRLDLDALGLDGLPPWLSRSARFVSRHRTTTAAMGAVASAALRGWTAPSAFRMQGLSVSFVESLDPAELDGLWERVRTMLPAAPVRDGRYLQWRYGASHGSAYQFVAVRDGSVLAGFAVVRRPRTNGDSRLHGLRVATLSDIVAPPNRSGVALAALAGAEALARGFDADAVLCSASHRRLRRLLPARAFIPIPGNLHVLVRDPGGACRLPRALDQWWLTRGDGDSDEVF